MGKVANLSVFTPGGQPGAPNPSEGLAVLRQNQTAFMETIGVMPPEALTIADGAISPTTAVCIVDAEGGAPADDLTTINATLSDGGTLHDGMVILLSAKDASRVVTVKNSDAPNGVKTVDGKDIALSPKWCLVLQYVGGVWQQINVSAPLKPATGTTLGGVKVGDGLTMQDGVMSADLATDAKAGRVKASETAKAGAVPLGGEDGSLGEDWLKKAMQAAEAAQKKADDKTTPAQVAEYGAPDFARSIDITISTTSYTQCIPEDGFLQIVWSGSNAQAYNYILKSTTGSEQPDTKYLCAFTGEGFVHSGLFPVAKGIYLKRQSTNTGNFEAQFIPAKGANGNA